MDGSSWNDDVIAYLAVEVHREDVDYIYIDASYIIKLDT
ncbi:hypothetical protein SAMN04487934_11336 [Eubacterium ruminantium]|nr:hypothetical protein SAMN04487934_11336 [Eubacterium ruminantium]